MEDITTWAAQLMNSDDWCVLDTETTGLSDNDEIIDIAIISKTGETLVNQLIRPFRKISADASAVHGITTEHLVNAPSFAGAWPEIHNTLSKFKRAVTYNADFDNRMLRQSASKAGMLLFMSKRAHDLAESLRRAPAYNTFRDKLFVELPIDWECLMKRYADYYYGPGGRWQKLQEACTQQNVSVEDLEFHRWHRAWGDALAALSLIKALAAKAETSESSPAPVPGVEVFDLEKGRIV